jgi:hypothetical protein
MTDRLSDLAITMYPLAQAPQNTSSLSPLFF